MGNPNDFDLNDALDKWQKANCSGDEFTPANIEEMRDHMLFTVEELSNDYDLSEEEAFVVARVRFGDAGDWDLEMQAVNEDNFQLRKVVFLFGGVLMYFILYHLIICMSQLFFLWLDYYNNSSPEINILYVKKFIISTYFLGGILTVSLFFMEDWVINLLGKIKIKPWHIVLLLTFLLGEFFFGRYLRYNLLDSLEKSFRFQLLMIFNHFSYIFPSLFGLGFFMLFFRYRKKFLVI